LVLVWHLPCTHRGLLDRWIDGWEWEDLHPSLFSGYSDLGLRSFTFLGEVTLLPATFFLFIIIVITLTSIRIFFGQTVR
jgi:hypothetical protein